MIEIALKLQKGYLYAAIGGIVVKEVDIVNLLREDGYVCSELSMSNS